MTLSRSLLIIGLATITVMGMSFGLSFAHLMEAPPRLWQWSGELWRETTVFHGQYFMFGQLGGPIDIGSILLGFILAYWIGRERPAMTLALISGVLFAISLVVWLAVVAPANAVMASWQPGPLPDDFEAIRTRWETGHIVMSAIKLPGLLCAAAALALAHRPEKRR